MPDDSIKPQVDKQEPPSDTNHGDEPGPDVVTASQSLIDPPKEPQDAKAADQPSTKNDRSENPQRENWPPRWSVIVECLLTAAIAYFAWGQVKFGKLQWDAAEKQYGAMDKQNEATKDQLKLAAETIKVMRDEQRPWISIQPPTMETAAGRDDRRLRFNFKNVGKTPAKITGFAVETFGPKSTYSRGVKEGMPSFDLGVAADIDAIIEEMSKPTKLDECEVLVVPNDPVMLTMRHLSFDKVKASGNAQFAFICYVAYTDAIGNVKGKTWTCFVYAPMLGEKQDELLGEWVLNPRYHHME
jgi:hypothetical protein